MRVLVVGTGGDVVSGITTAADQMARTLREMGHEVERVAAGSRMRRRPNRVNLENALAVLSDAVTVARAARRARADVVWYHTFGVPTLPAMRALMVVLASLVVGRRAVVHFHAFGLEEFVRRGGAPLRVGLFLLGRAARFVVVVHEAAAAALRQFVPAHRIIVLSNWVEVPPTRPSLPPGPPFILVFTGGLIERKGVPQLIAAMRLLDDPSVVLRFIGGPGEDGPDALARLHASAADLVAAGRVHFVGQLSPPEVREELQRGHLYVLPSRAEGSPLGMLEAMAEGRPVLVGDAGNMSEIVGSSGCGRVLADRRPETIAAAISALCGDLETMGAMGQAGHEYAVRRHSSEAARIRVEEILSSVETRIEHDYRRRKTIASDSTDSEY